MKNIIRISIGFIVIGLITTVSSCDSNKEKQMKIEWSKLSTDGLSDNLAKGVSASYSALIDGNIIVAGGANFPDKLGFEGGSKALYDEVLMYNFDDETWRQVGTLPQKSAYGVSINSINGTYWIGGNTDSTSLNSVYHVTLKDGEVNLNQLVSLPASMDNFAGGEINNKLFVAGGSVDGIASNSIYMLDLNDDDKWIKLLDFPGIPRVQPVISCLEIDGKEYLFLLGGFFTGDSQNIPAMATDILRFDISENKWDVVGAQIDDNLNPFSLGGATAMPYDNRYIICFGGVNHDVFLDAISTQYAIGHDDNLSSDEKAVKNLEFSKNYMTQPIEYYNFNKEVRAFDTHLGVWTTIESNDNCARAGATLVSGKDSFYLVQGELKPGVRSPDTWKGKIEFE